MAGIYMPQHVHPESSDDQTDERGTPTSKWPNSNQGAFITLWDPAAFLPRAEYDAEMDRYISQVRQLEPFPGLESADLPGGMEARRRCALGGRSPTSCETNCSPP